MKTPLKFKTVHENKWLVSDTVYQAIGANSGVMVAEIDPQYMSGLALSEYYDCNPEDGANCMVIKGRRGEIRMMAAILVPVGYRADLNGVVCEKLNAKKVTMAPLEEVLQETGMEYGSITPVGLPLTYKILIDARLMSKERIIVGGGKQISKLSVPTKFLKILPNVEVVENLALNSS